MSPDITENQYPLCLLYDTRTTTNQNDVPKEKRKKKKKRLTNLTLAQQLLPIITYDRILARKKRERILPQIEAIASFYLHSLESIYLQKCCYWFCFLPLLERNSNRL